MSTRTEQREAVDQLRAILPPGSTVHTVLRHVSRSGMSRSISLVVCDNGEPSDITWLAVRAGLGRFDRDRGGIKVAGCGMDMGFSLVYDLGRTIYPDGHCCSGPDCPSNDHSNGDRTYNGNGDWTHTHADGGYALRHRWL